MYRRSSRHPFEAGQLPELRRVPEWKRVEIKYTRTSEYVVSAFAS